MGTLALSGAALFHAGANVSTNLTEPDYDYAILQAEDYIYAVMRQDLSGAYATMLPSKKLLLERACSKLAAIDLIKYDMSKYPSLAEATTMINILWSDVLLTLSLLKDKKTQDFLT